MKYKIPKCPNCGKELKAVWENDYRTYIFNPKTGRYDESEYRGEIETRCPECEIDVGEIFEEGACNYQAEEEKEEK